MSYTPFSKQLYHNMEAQEVFDKACLKLMKANVDCDTLEAEKKVLKAEIGQYADYWPIKKEENMKKKADLKVPKDYSDICQACGQNYGKHNGFNCTSGSIGSTWVAPEPKLKLKLGVSWPDFIAPQNPNPQQLDNDLKVVETVLKAIMQTSTTKSLSMINAIAAVRYVTNMTLVEAKDVTDKWSKKYGWWKEYTPTTCEAYKPYYPGAVYWPLKMPAFSLNDLDNQIAAYKQPEAVSEALTGALPGSLASNSIKPYEPPSTMLKLKDFKSIKKY